ncbi:GPI mannosyltransferase 2 isoform X2 [Impatiens glandulifera]|uniref:GPI mannosyltransferase 2 isoform X2 n=1 Tax=Impatiens glandulifera TaxID=253017 RepID=UPI001FB1341C|nr:GPI mannosyltransferase 2 isoform X2 [Impatiens glandulifera]
MASKSSTEVSSYNRTVLRSATASRLLLISLIVLWRSVLRPYDTSANINATCLSSSAAPSQIVFPRVAALIENSIVWDSVYFVRIAQCGYEYEQSYAFLPLLPICMSTITRTVFLPLVPLFGHRAVLGLSGYVINNIAFIFSALYLYRLSVVILKDRDAALRASLLFCFNPASIFYSSIYSESLYSLLSLGGLYALLSGADNAATLVFSFSGCARSNGVVNAGYICYQTMHRAYRAIFHKKDCRVLAVGALRCLCIFVPFIAFQAFGYYNICLGHSTDKMRPWCKKRIPLLYNFIQSHYWGVGFLKYFQLRQLPNFLLASPILFLALSTIFHYVKQRPEVFFSLGLLQCSNVDEDFQPKQLAEKEKIVSGSGKSSQENSVLHKRKQKRQIEDFNVNAMQHQIADEQECVPNVILPFVFHLGFMVATAFFVMHVQVSTRFLSASPPLYWFATYIARVSKRWGYMIWAYSAAYILLGSLLFSNFYPFT